MENKLDIIGIFKCFAIFASFVLFTIVNLSRHLGYDAESSLKNSTEKFSRRFKKIEKDLKNKNIKIQDLSLEELDEIWEKNKYNDKN